MALFLKVAFFPLHWVKLGIGTQTKKAAVR